MDVAFSEGSLNFSSVRSPLLEMLKLLQVQQLKSSQYSQLATIYWTAEVDQVKPLKDMLLNDTEGKRSCSAIQSLKLKYRQVWKMIQRLLEGSRLNQKSNR